MQITEKSQYEFSADGGTAGIYRTDNYSGKALNQAKQAAKSIHGETSEPIQ